MDLEEQEELEEDDAELEEDAKVRFRSGWKEREELEEDEAEDELLEEKDSEDVEEK